MMVDKRILSRLWATALSRSCEIVGRAHSAAKWPLVPASDLTARLSSDAPTMEVIRRGTNVIDENDAPGHLFDIPELDFSEDLFAERLPGQWFRLGARTVTPHRDERAIEDVVSRQALLIRPSDFARIFDALGSVGNVVLYMGKPGGYVAEEAGDRKYGYAPFHRFEIPFTSILAEPLVFGRDTTSGTRLLINPDLWLFLELEEKTSNSGIWWDPRRGVEALRQRLTQGENLEIAEIRTDYLLKYLRARQMSLLVGHYRHLHLFDPSPTAIERFVEEDVTLGSPEQGTKAVLQNSGLRDDIAQHFLQRRLHLWVCFEPPPVDTEDPWDEEPLFDPYAFTLPTAAGPVAPARWKLFLKSDGRTFEGEICDFMDRVYFRQEVLTKYEGSSGFDIADDGSVSCRHYWGLVRSTLRLGNELLSTAIGDFAEGVPFEEWPHWKQYAVEPPSRDASALFREEQTVADAVNSVVQALRWLNNAFDKMSLSFRVELAGPLWRGSLDSVAGRQMKWVYPAGADDDEFLKRATLTSTLVLDAIEPVSLRRLLAAVSEELHLKDGTPLGSRNLLQRVTLIAALIENFRPAMADIPILVRQAEHISKAADPDLQIELEALYRRLREEFAPLAFLYDLRTYGGLAHHPNITKAKTAAIKLGLPGENWHRTDYLSLLGLVAKAILRVSEHLGNAAIA